MTPADIMTIGGEFAAHSIYPLICSWPRGSRGPTRRLNLRTHGA